VDGGDTPATRAFMAIAETVLDVIDKGSGLKPAPRILIED
jgi:hypothetical protein